ncbi:MAG: 2-oxo acid dehydrogenase subunit E2 [Eubacteriales bacterium]|nr:2-oxo acid dehydrogenase subunit E2 [Eubacteriales bacterium]
MKKNTAYKRRRGDRRDGRLVKDNPGLNTIMAFLWPNRTDCEVYLHDTVDCTELLKYLEKRNEGKTEEKMTLFHCTVTALARMFYERPKMNRFVQGGRTYERYDKLLSFVAKRRFTDHAEETLMVLNAKPEMTVDDISRKIIGDVRESRKSEKATGGVDELLDTLAKFPRLFLLIFIRCIRWLDFWGRVPKSLTDGDPNFTSVTLSNLGSIKCPSVYHHLSNYGTTSILLTIGVIHKEEMLMEDGHKEIRDCVDIGATLDERIADGFYFAKSLKLVKHLFANPELLELPIGTDCGFDYK